MVRFLVGAAFSREKNLLDLSFHDRGWKPLLQSKWHKLPLLNLFEVPLKFFNGN